MAPAPEFNSIGTTRGWGASALAIGIALAGVLLAGMAPAQIAEDGAQEGRILAPPDTPATAPRPAFPRPDADPRDEGDLKRERQHWWKDNRQHPWKEDRQHWWQQREGGSGER